MSVRKPRPAIPALSHTVIPAQAGILCGAGADSKKMPGYSRHNAALQSSTSREVLMKYLEIMWDFKVADSRRDLPAMASPLAKNPNKEDAILKPHPKGLSQNPIYLISPSLDRLL